MSNKSRWLLGLACVAMIIGYGRAFPSIAVGEDLADFSIGLAAALMFGVMITWKKCRVE